MSYFNIVLFLFIIQKDTTFNSKICGFNQPKYTNKDNVMVNNYYIIL